MADSKVILSRFARLSEDSVAKKIPYFTAEEVTSLLNSLGVNTPIIWTVWSGDTTTEIQPHIKRLRDLLWSHEASELNYKGGLHRIEVCGVRTLSVARIIELMYHLASLADYGRVTDKELESIYGSIWRERGGRRYKDWWYVALEMMRNDYTLLQKRFPDLF